MNIGNWNRLKVIGTTDHGMLLDGGEEHGSILFPQKYVFDGCEMGETVKVFVYPDSSDRLIATTETPLALVGEFAFLECVDANRVGAFCEIGLAKQLMIPYAEQDFKMVPGESYIIHVRLDTVSQRLIGSTKLHRFLNKKGERYFEDQEVEILVYEETEIGFKVIVNQLDRGMIFHSEIFQNVKVGDQLNAYVYLTRPDGKLDLCLQLPAEKKVAQLEQVILDRLQQEGGKLPVSDKSPSEEIQKTFHCSKKTFKRALGSLYKKRHILISSSEIQLTGE